MQPWEILERLQNLQTAANNVTVASAAVSYAIGEYIKFLSSNDDMVHLPKYASRLQKCLVAHQDALEKYCEAAARAAGGEST